MAPIVTTGGAVSAVISRIMAVGGQTHQGPEILRLAAFVTNVNNSQQ